MATAHHQQFSLTRTYATRENAIKAVERKYGPSTDRVADADLKYLICVDEHGRFYPVFIGEEAVRRGVHFHFAVTA